MDFQFPQNISFLETILPQLDTSDEVEQILDFSLQSIEKNYGFEGVGIQLVDYEKQKIKFYKLYTPTTPKEISRQIEAMEIPLSPLGGICYFVVEKNLIVYFEDVQEIDLELYYISDYDLKSIQLLKHRTHLIIPVNFEDRVHVLIHLSSYSQKIPLKQEEIQKIKVLCINLGRVLYKTLTFKKVYEEKQKLMMDILKAHEAREVFLAGINHELKTPLNAIMGFSEYLSSVKKLDLEKVHNMGAIIHKNGKLLLSIIQEIIEVYKINSGKITVESTLLELEKIIQEVVHSLLPLYKKKKQSIQIISEHCSLESDYKRLSQILYNLISNAVKYSPEKRKILVRGCCDENKVVIEVKDNGIGMDEEDLKNLFIPFKRGKKAYKTEEGSGLGLFVTHQVVQILGGSLEVESEPGKGSLFRIILPRIREAI